MRQELGLVVVGLGSGWRGWDGSGVEFQPSKVGRVGACGGEVGLGGVPSMGRTAGGGNFKLQISRTCTSAGASINPNC